MAPIYLGDLLQEANYYGGKFYKECLRGGYTSSIPCSITPKFDILLQLLKNDS